jgi:hypothetical protein
MKTVCELRSVFLGNGHISELGKNAKFTFQDGCVTVIRRSNDIRRTKDKLHGFLARTSQSLVPHVNVGRCGRTPLWANRELSTPSVVCR